MTPFETVLVPCVVYTVQSTSLAAMKLFSKYFYVFVKQLWIDKLTLFLNFSVLRTLVTRSLITFDILLQLEKFKASISQSRYRASFETLLLTIRVFLGNRSKRRVCSKTTRQSKFFFVDIHIKRNIVR